MTPEPALLLPAFPCREIELLECRSERSVRNAEGLQQELRAVRRASDASQSQLDEIIYEQQQERQKQHQHHQQHGVGEEGDAIPVGGGGVVEEAEAALLELENVLQQHEARNVFRPAGEIPPGSYDK